MPVSNKFFTTSAGVQIGVQPVPPLLVEKVRAAAAASVEVPPIPTYMVVIGENTEVPAEHDATTLETDEDKAAWTRYEKALKQRESVSGTKTMELFLIKGTTIEPPNDDWAAEQAYFGVTVPEDPAGRKLHYIQTELLNTTDDISGLMSAIVAASGIDPEVITAAKATFRGDVRPAEHAAGGTDRAAQAESAGAMVHESAV